MSQKPGLMIASKSDDEGTLWGSNKKCHKPSASYCGCIIHQVPAAPVGHASCSTFLVVSLTARFQVPAVEARRQLNGLESGDHDLILQTLHSSLGGLVMS